MNFIYLICLPLQAEQLIKEVNHEKSYLSIRQSLFAQSKEKL